MTAKKYDLAIKVGEYEKNGETKGRYKNIGAVMQTDKGMYMLLDSTVISTQLFALCNKERRDSVIVSMFEPKSADGSARKPASEPTPAGADPEDEIPF